MTLFTFDIDNPSSQYIQITAEFEVSNKETLIQLPSWRPGRYELANFAKNVKGFKVFDAANKVLKSNKTTKDSWLVNTSDTNSIKVQYQFYATIINAGSSFLDANQLYVNPVNCCVFTEEVYHKEIEIKLNVPSEWDIASSMDKLGDNYTVTNFDELFDTPFIASNQLQHNEYESGGVRFHVWFNGEVKPDWKRLIKDFKAFTDIQMEKFSEFPVKEYHFINQILPFKNYHGVEHQKSTVISLGPSYDVFGSLYKELLGVSSHELYHTWNVKAIRPIEMFPYDFTKENYSTLGYICEGITTYQGDLFLLKSGVFNEEQYFEELNSQLQKHFDNSGRFNYSVAESSFDTWLDGYLAGAPGRKVSIYTEGCLLAFVTDVMVRRATTNKFGLDDVMRRLYFNFALKGKGVSEADYKSTLENVSGIPFDEFFSDYVNGNKPYESIIVESLDYLGLELNHTPVESYSAGRLGFKTIASGKNFIVKAMYPGGPAEIGRLMLEDEIIAVNDYSCSGELNKWLQYFDDVPKTVTVMRSGVLKKVLFPEVNRNFYMKYSISKINAPKKLLPTILQKTAFDHWKK